MSRLFASGGQSIGVSALTLVLPMKEQYFLRITQDELSGMHIPNLPLLLGLR